VHEGAENNLPDQAAEEAALEIKKLAEAMTPNDVLIVLISGGGSALLPMPVSPITLPEKTATIKLLANSGVTINELNIVRIGISGVKGGKLLDAAKNAASVVSLILSDIVNDPIELIASGPTVSFDVSRSPTPMSILTKYTLMEKVPKSVLNALKTDLLSERKTYDNSTVHVIGSNVIAIEAAAQEAKTLGWHPVVLSYQVQGHIKDLARAYVELAVLIQKLRNGKLTEDDFRKVFEGTLQAELFVDNLEVMATIAEAKSRERVCFIAGGEPTATVTGSGKGGRNQELALRFTQECQRRKEELKEDGVVFLAAGTDGIDGPTPAAGAIGGLLVAENADNLRVSNFLTKSDSFSFYESLANGKFHIITGHTGTNVMDLHLLAIH
jgi:glycerate 2-kinase